MRNVCVLTGSRADYGLLYPVIKKIKLSKKLKLQLIAFNAHLSKEFGTTYVQIEQDGIKIDEKVDNLIYDGINISIPKSSAAATSKLSEVFSRLIPDLILILGDRYEAHAAATAALLMKIPIAHIHGGEISEGAIDEYLRHSITKMSYLHFCSTETYRNRIIQMGEDPDRVFITGAPGIDNILSHKAITKNQLEKKLDWSFSNNSALFTYHPETLSENDGIEDLNIMLNILNNLGINLLITYANADEGGNIFNLEIEKYIDSKSNNFKVVKNLGQQDYFSAIRYVDFVVGNSSSGIIEVASFGKPVINIGDRQKGRLRNANVIDCNINSLERAINKALSDKFKSKCKDILNIYGTGNASEKIVEQLENQDLRINKVFFDM
jgi:GDP/UDP-N,N'-diacetylbacillosamine 2-epimerase (hydrolysing)